MATLPITLEKGSLPHRGTQAVGYGLIALAVILLAVSQPDFQLVNLSKVAAYAVAVLGLNLVTGFSGQVSLGHSAFFGVGAYTTAILFTDEGWPFLATIPVAFIFGALFGFLVGLPALRLRGLYLALVTLALGASFPVLLKLDALADKTGASNGKPVDIAWKKPGWFSLDVSNTGWKFLVLSLMAAVAFLLVSNLVRSRVGRSLQALRDNETGAAVSGVWPAGWKTGAFAVSAGIAAVAGGMFVLVIPIVSPESIGFALAIQLITGLVLGGAGTVSGSLIGGICLVYLPYLTAEKTGSFDLLFVDPSDSGLLANVVYGLLLIGVVFVMPGGIIWFVRLVRSRIVRFAPRLPKVSSATDDVTAPPGAPAPAGAPSQGGPA
jgi:branched-chain amino acid transport system permease protein